MLIIKEYHNSDHYEQNHADLEISVCTIEELACHLSLRAKVALRKQDTLTTYFRVGNALAMWEFAIDGHDGLENINYEKWMDYTY